MQALYQLSYSPEVQSYSSGRQATLTTGTSL